MGRCLAASDHLLPVVSQSLWRGHSSCRGPSPGASTASDHGGETRKNPPVRVGRLRGIPCALLHPDLASASLPGRTASRASLLQRGPRWGPRTAPPGAATRRVHTGPAAQTCVAPCPELHGPVYTVPGGGGGWGRPCFLWGTLEDFEVQPPFLLWGVAGGNRRLCFVGFRRHRSP